MGPLALMALMGAVGAAKSEVIDRPKENRARKLKAETQRYSPWTGLKGEEVKEADPFGSALQFGASGASMGSAMEQANLDKALADRLNTGGSLGGTGANLAARDRNPWNFGSKSSYLGTDNGLGY